MIFSLKKISFTNRQDNSAEGREEEKHFSANSRLAALAASYSLIQAQAPSKQAETLKIKT